MKALFYLFTFFCLNSAWASGELTLLHEVGVRPEVQSRTSFEFVWDWDLSASDRIRVDQLVSKVYDVRPPQTEFSVEDTVIYSYHRFQSPRFTLRLGVTLPLSRFSRLQGVITRTGATLQFQQPIAGETLALSYWPYVQVQWNQSTTTISGTPHNKIRLGNTIFSTLKFGNGFSHRLIFDAAYAWSESISGGVQAFARGKYSWETYLAYTFHSQWDARVGFLHGDDFLKNGRYQMLFFDPTLSTFYGALDFRI